MKLTTKEYIILSITIMTIFLWFVEWQDIFYSLKKFYSRVFYVLCVIITLLYLFYIGKDFKLWMPFIKKCYALVFSFAIVNLFFAFHSTFVGLINWNSTPYEVDKIIEQSHDNYIIDYGTPILIFIIAILLSLWWKYKRF